MVRLSKRKTKAWTLRLYPERINLTDRVLDDIADEQGFTGIDVRRQSFDYLIDLFMLGFENQATPVVIDRLHGKIECDLLVFDHGSWFCMETMKGAKKEPTDLGDDSELVYKKCQGCITAKTAARAEFEYKESRKANIRKILEFRKLFLKIAKDGFSASVRFCSADVGKTGGLFISQDGQTLPCPLKDYQAVNVDRVCKMVIDPKTGSPPCQFLVEELHQVRPDIQKEAQALELEALPEPDRKVID